MRYIDDGCLLTPLDIVAIGIVSVVPIKPRAETIAQVMYDLADVFDWNL